MSGKAHILVVEDDVNIRNGLVATLESEGFTATAATDGEDALTLVRQNTFDLLLLDIMMPRKSGYDVCRELRAQNNDVPVIMLTAKGEEIDKVVGLQLGADDYVTKPFGIHELIARIDAVLRRTRQTATHAREPAPRPSGTFQFAAADIDPRRFEAKVGRKVHALSDRELRLLWYFKQHANEVLSRDELLNAVWGVEYYGTTRTLDQHIAKLRKKVQPSSRPAPGITTVHGVGYRYEEE